MNIQEYLAPTGEQPLDRMVTDGGFFSIFRTVACVGDSLSSGEFEATGDAGQTLYLDMFEYSWGQYLARMTGAKVYNFSRGGMTAIEYCRTFAEANHFWDPDKACQAYIVALGVNDILNCRQPVGTLADICEEDWHKNADTFAGWYGQLLQRLRAISPDAKFFLMTMPRATWTDRGGNEPLLQAHADLLHQFAAHYPNTYVIDLHAYAPKHDEAFIDAFYMGGHLNAMGYRLTAEQVASYIDYIIRHDPKSFKQVPFIGTPYKKVNP